MKRKEDTLQKSVDFFQEQYGRLLDISQHFDLLANEIKTISSGLNTQFEFCREARDRMREWNGAQVSSNQLLTEIKAQLDVQVELLGSIKNLGEQFQSQLDALKLEMNAKLAENRKETQQMLVEFLAKINGVMAEQEQKTASIKNRNFF